MEISIRKVGTHLFLVRSDSTEKINNSIENFPDDNRDDNRDYFLMV